IEGDGIGREVVPEGIRVLEVAARRFGLSLSWTNFDWSCETYLSTGRMMPEDALQQLRPFDAIYLGAVGYPGVPDHVSLWGLLIPIRRGFKQYVNLRPCRLLEGITTPLSGRKAGEIDFCIVRENSEGEYSEIGGRLHRNTDLEMAIQETVFTRRGCDRIITYAFELARSRKNHVTSATKSNGIVFTMPFWDERFAAVAQNYPQVKTDQYHIDILTAHFVSHPDRFDVVVGSNLFGDSLPERIRGLAHLLYFYHGHSLERQRSTGLASATRTRFPRLRVLEFFRCSRIGPRSSAGRHTRSRSATLCLLKHRRAYGLR